MLADDDDRVGMLIRRRTREKVKRSGGQRVLVGAPVNVRAHQLFGCGVGDRSHGEICGGESADLAALPGYSEVGQQDSSFTVFWLGEQDVGRFDVAMQYAPLMGVVERAGHRGDDGAHVMCRHSRRVLVFDQLRGVGAVDVVHRDPQLAIELAAVMHADNDAGGDSVAARSASR